MSFVQGIRLLTKNKCLSAARSSLFLLAIYVGLLTWGVLFNGYHVMVTLSISRVSGEGGEVRRRAPNGSSKSYAKDMEPTVLASIERAVIDCL